MADEWSGKFTIIFSVTEESAKKGFVTSGYTDQANHDGAFTNDRISNTYTYLYTS